MLAVKPVSISDGPAYVLQNVGVNKFFIGGYMQEIIDKYRKWKKENPDPDYQYDMIHDFF